ncbi:hypothetical protein [Ferroacidibacillus organovorans]|uniref:Uncharacterized protein n=1 Tax=Ferroacidibacillus organovorans TaxID=1765683 RepID=A0A162U9E9_9BACL|nr:hypothetical protein [Ferroacidibacillus organovorans]KYP81574.1 hypothetical protein AYJ22_07030 [Ferroacidibacillus organovorans]OAG94091.1 hypothetical protein AYW79_07075 [Ferroacidibacillus organovorans]OPG16301.1 hypothetical protein B2M26_07230 [Ferroacidibacillus organovorans]
MRKTQIATLLLLPAILTGCASTTSAHSNHPTKGSHSATNVSNATTKEINATHFGYESYGIKIHFSSNKYQVQAYTPSLGFIGINSALKPYSRYKFKAGYGSMIQLSTNKVLPQPSPIIGYEPAFILSNGQFLCYIYQSQGIGPDYGEIVYAYNIKTKITTKLWNPANGTNQQLSNFHLTGNQLYFAVQSTKGNTAFVQIHRVNLPTMRQNIVFSSKGGINQYVVEDFAISKGKIGIIWTPGSHFIPVVDHNPYEPYDVTIGAINGTTKKVIFRGVNAGAFNMQAKNGIWAWSDLTSGVECYSSRINTVWNVSSQPSYVKTDGVTVWWRSVNTNQCGGFDTKTQKFVKFNQIKAPFTPIISDGRVILLTGIHTDYWTLTK